MRMKSLEYPVIDSNRWFGFGFRAPPWKLLFPLGEHLIFVFFSAQELRDRISTSDSVSDEVQDVFGRQLLVLQTQRDSLLHQLEQQKKDRSSYVDMLEEKNALEDSLR